MRIWLSIFLGNPFANRLVFIRKARKMNTAIIVGSARKGGNTHKVIDYFQSKTQWPVYDLLDYEINYFDYDNRFKDDDFMPLIRELIHNYDTLLFATPVYWYMMSAQLKTFFDRISDLLKFDKPLGRQLRGKSMAALSCANDEELVDGFFMPFEASADYLGMHYLGHIHTWVEKGTVPPDLAHRINEFLLELFRQS